MDNGSLVISLDFELMWGVRDVTDISKYGLNIKGVHDVIPRLLKLFEYYNISVTFSTVGFLFHSNLSELKAHIPDVLPSYVSKELSPYGTYLDQISSNDEPDIYHFAPNIINEILNKTTHEIGSHTYSHYYCLAEGADIESFESDLRMSIKVMEKWGIKCSSIVFPRNQVNEKFLEVCKKLGVKCYRGTQSHWIYSVKSDFFLNVKPVRFVRLLDAYFNLSGHNCFKVKSNSDGFYNVPASQFLRPYNSKFSIFEPIRLRRIKKSMTHAAKNGLVYHLWWHPHNFGINQDNNIHFLSQILDHFKELNEIYNFESTTMSQLLKNMY